MNTKQIRKRLVKNAMAVSPIIATLMLVLVAVGSAGAFYVWQTGWQSEIEGKVGGSGELQASLSIGGSSTVYEFSAVATEHYSAANPNYKVSYQKGGSGAGVASVGTGAIDIGSASRYVKTSEKADYPDMNKDGNKDIGRELVEHVIAWDGVCVVVPEGNSHGLVSIDEFTLRDIYSFNGGESGYTLQVLTDTGSIPAKIAWDEVPVDTYIDETVITYLLDPLGTGVPADGQPAIANVEVGVDGTTVTDYIMWIEEGTTAGFQVGVDTTITLDLDGDGTGALDVVDAAAIANVEVAVDSATPANGYYMFIDADTSGTYTGTETVITDDLDRTTAAAQVLGDPAIANTQVASDGGDYYMFIDDEPTNNKYDVQNFCTGTEEVKIYDRDEESGTEEVFSKQIIDTGKGTLEGAGITATHETSNQNLLTAIADDDDALSFMSFGMAKASTSGLKIIPFQGDDDTDPIMPDEDSIMDLTYDGARPLVYITVGNPTGDVKQYIDFCLQPENNMNICEASDYISIYA